MNSMNVKYKRMIDGLKKKTRKLRKKKREPWFLYVLKCSDGTLYTGITNNVQKRFQNHQSGKGARFTRTRLPLQLLYQESCASRSAALVREWQVKSFPRKKKELLVLGASQL